MLNQPLFSHPSNVFFFIQFNVPFKIISLIETSQSVGGAKREYPRRRKSRFFFFNGGVYFMKDRQDKYPNVSIYGKGNHKVFKLCICIK